MNHEENEYGFCECCDEAFTDDNPEQGEWVHYPSGHSSDYIGHGICKECKENPYEDPYMEVVRENCAAL